MTPIKVLHLIGSMDLGGAEKLTRLTVEGLPKDRFAASVCCIKNGGLYADQLRGKGFKVWELLGVDKHTRVTPILIVKAAWRLFRLLRREQPDIIHVHLFGASVLGRVVGRMSGSSRIVVTMHRIEYPRFQPLVERFLAPLSAVYVTDSHAAATRLSDALGIRAGDIRVIYNGIDRSEFDTPPSREGARASLALSPDTPAIAVIAHLVPAKGHAFLLRALAECQELPADLTILVVGDGYLRPTLEDQAKRLFPAGQVRFLGQRADLATLLSAVDVLVLPSSFEGFGIILAEAMYMRVPVVTTSDGGGCAEVVAEEDGGLLVPFGDTVALGKALVRIVNDQSYRGIMGVRGRSRVERMFSGERMVEQYAALYLRVLE